MAGSEAEGMGRGKCGLKKDRTGGKKVKFSDWRKEADWLIIHQVSGLIRSFGPPAALVTTQVMTRTVTGIYC